jgi:hypothetical protein
MTTTSVLSAFLTRLDTLAFSPEIPIAWPGVVYDPPSTGMWLEASLFPNEPRELSWDSDSCHDTRGFCQVSVFYRKGGGQVDASTTADAIIAHFPKGLALGPVRVQKRPWQSPAVPLDDRIFIPVTIRYQGIT